MRVAVASLGFLVCGCAVSHGVRPLPAGTGAITRVMIEHADDAGHHWNTVGVSANIIDASYNALFDGLVWKLLQEGAAPPGEPA